MVTKGGQMPMSFLQSLSQKSGRPVMVAALLHNSTNPDVVFKDLQAISEANDHGSALIGQVSCCPLTMDFTFASAYPVEGLASWKPAMGLTHTELKVCLADQTFRHNVKMSLHKPPHSVCSITNGTKYMWCKHLMRNICLMSNAASLILRLK